jgi:hypothetical protein
MRRSPFADPEPMTAFTTLCPTDSNRRRQVATALRWATGLLGTLLATGLHAELVKDAAGCGVHAPASLAKDEYTFQYTGACQDSLAQGQGQASWTLKNAPSAKTVWKGRFTQGVYQAEPLPHATGKALKGEQVLFDVGPIASSSGIGSARLQVQASFDMTTHANACRPNLLYVTLPSEADLGNDEPLKMLVRDAVRQLASRCGTTFDLGQRQGMRVELLGRHEITPDRFGNLPSGLARTSVSADGQFTLGSFQNEVSGRARQAQARQAQSAQQEATQARLAGFFKRHGAEAWAPMASVAQNPFRFNDQVLVGAARLVRVESPQVARIAPLEGWPTLRLNGAVGSWETGSYLLAFKASGREEKKEGQQGDATLTLVGFERCALPDCGDWLDLPKPLQPGARP